MVRAIFFSNRKALIAGLGTSLAVLAAIYFGSLGLKHFDPAVTIYAAGSVAAAFALGYRFAAFAQRPPTRMYLQRGAQLFWTAGPIIPVGRLPTGAGRLPAPPIFQTGSRPWEMPRTLGSELATNFVGQNFIRRRSAYRWIMHLCLSGGGTVAFAITFPLVFGWVHFQTRPDNAEVYRAVVFGLPLGEFNVHSLVGFLVFNLLNLSALALLVGLIMAGLRRIRDLGERAVQSFREDFLPLILLAWVTVSGLLLTVSYKFLAGQGHAGIGVVHAISVLALLLYLPFGKLFHIAQRSVALAVALHKKAGARGPWAGCARCGEDFASQLQVDDLKIVLDQLGFNYRFATPQGDVHYQDVCPACRRKLLALNQGRSLGR